ncbi:MAG TPA: hypothetical protein PLR18_03960, partial [bacterium]|nr:hypothetical protein [bacterium]
MRLLAVAVVVLVALFAVASVAQAQGYSQDEVVYLERLRGLTPDRQVAKVWLDICNLNNKQYPDSNVIAPDDYLALPLDGYYQVRNEGGKDHMWRAARFFVQGPVAYYFIDNPVGPPAPSIPKSSDRTDGTVFPWGKLLLGLAALALVCAILYGAFRLARKPFISQPPDFWTATEEEVSAAAHEALQPTAGQGFQFIGRIQRGILNGEQIGFYRGGG